MKYIISLLLFLSFISEDITAQPKCYIEHYGTEDGLPQHTVMDIVQDKKGFMWFSTWDGLSKFDGYNFYSYKIQQGDVYHMRSNRMDKITEDKYGYIWALSYDKEPHRFDPHTETFMGLRSLKEYENLATITEKLIPMPSGKVWIIPEKSGCICVIDSTFRVKSYNILNKKILGNKVYDILEDKDMNSWILSDNGVYLESPEGEITHKFFIVQEPEDVRRGFYSALDLDSEIWFGSDDGKVYVYDKKRKRFDEVNIHLKSPVNFILNVNNNHLLIATRDKGFLIYHKPTRKLEAYNMSNLPAMKTNNIISCYVDKAENIWFELECPGVAKFDISTRTMKHFEMKIESLSATVYPPNFFIFEDLSGRLWVHPRGGGFSFYDPSIDTLVSFYNEPYSPGWRFSNMMHAAFSDKQGNLWMSTRSHGLEKVIFTNEVFRSMIVDPNIPSSIDNDIRAVFEDSGENLWVSTKGGKIFVYDSGYNKQGYLCNDGSLGYGVPLDGFCYSIIEDKDRNIWIGTKGEGVYKLIPANNARHYKIVQYKNEPGNPYSLNDNSIYNIFQDRNGRIWIGTYGGGINYLDESSGEPRFINNTNNLKQYPIRFGSQIRIISADQFGNVCIGTTLGLIMFSPDFKDPSEILFKSYIREPQNNNSLAGNDIYDICTTKDGETFIATFGGGVNKVIEVDRQGFPLKFKGYTVQNGLPSDVILTIVEDHDNKLWIATEGNLTKFDPKKEAFETYSEISRLIEGQNFSEGARVTSKSGEVYFGYSRGLLSVKPDRIIDNTFKPYVALTNFQIANKNVPIGPDSPLSNNIDDLTLLKLGHKQNFFSIGFAALDYVDPKNITYAYKLDGFDKDWIITQKQRVANYANMSPGKYVFRVKSTNSDGMWTDNEHRLDIEIVPSFWQTIWAYILYFVVFVLLIYTVLRLIFVFFRLRDKVKLEQEQTEMKTRFFIDISHEIRTPLTMIVSPIENIVEDNTTPSLIKQQLQLVLRNTHRMLRMVNQILDFRKVQKQKLNIRETPIASYVSDICANFERTAEYQEIKLLFNNQIKDEKLWVDRDSFEKLLFNLLSNAFKHTPKGKTIEVNLFNKDNTVALQVKDEGEGMTREIQNKLFTRFASFNKDKSQPSTGIGLSIVKEVADKHKARILVNTELNKGTSFTVLFNKGVAHYDDDVEIVYNDYSKDENANTPNSEYFEGGSKKEALLNDEQRETILIVEDDGDLRGFIKTALISHYDVLEAVNGVEAYEIAISQYPDFILSDIMMPEMDGVELLQKIRGNEKTSHIPFILLTAKTDIESRLEGLTYGADDYMTKPFSVRYLRARIENIMRMRFHLYENSRNQQVKTAAGSLAVKHEEKNEHSITEKDELFLQKIKEIVEQNIDNSNFVVEDLVSEMAMSRTVFFKKLKSLTGFAPIELIRDIKIRYAADMLEKQDYTIKEIAFMVGFSDTKYFTQCFKQIFGMPPSEYRNKNKTD